MPAAQSTAPPGARRSGSDVVAAGACAQFKGSKRLKTSVAALFTRRGGAFNPLQGSRARGWRAEQRVRLAKGVKVVATGAALRAKASTGTEVGRAVGVEGVYKPPSDIEGLELSAGYNTMRIEKLAVAGRSLGANIVHGGTLAMQKNVSPETIVNGRVQLSSSGQSSLGVRITSNDKLALRWSFLAPLLGFILDRILRRSQDAADF